jgi:hypothetical protein
MSGRFCDVCGSPEYRQCRRSLRCPPGGRGPNPWKSQCILTGLARMTNKACLSSPPSSQLTPTARGRSREGREKHIRCFEVWPNERLTYSANALSDVLHALCLECIPHSPSNRRVAGPRQTMVLSRLVSLPLLLAWSVAAKRRDAVVASHVSSASA